jgi:hypothetical protein
MNSTSFVKRRGAFGIRLGGATGGSDGTGPRLFPDRNITSPSTSRPTFPINCSRPNAHRSANSASPSVIANRSLDVQRHFDSIEFIAHRVARLCFSGENQKGGESTGTGVKSELGIDSRPLCFRPVGGERGATNVKRYVLMVCLIIGAVVVSLLGYPIGKGRWVEGFPIPFAVLEPAQSGDGMLPFTSSLSLIILCVDALVCVGTAHGALRYWEKSQKTTPPKPERVQ